jgi:hypothetical protein
MTSNLTNNEYHLLKLSFPFVNTSKLIKINSTIKTPTIHLLIDSDDYPNFKKQQDEKIFYQNQINELYKSNDKDKFIKIEKLLRKKTNICKNHLGFNAYCLLKCNYLWTKLII